MRCVSDLVSPSDAVTSSLFVETGSLVVDECSNVAEASLDDALNLVNGERFFVTGDENAWQQLLSRDVRESIPAETARAVNFII